MLLLRAALGRAVWRGVFWHVGSAYQRTMIGGLFGVVKGGFSGICRRTQEGGIPAYAGMTGGGGGNGGTQRRRGAMKSRRGRTLLHRGTLVARIYGFGGTHHGSRANPRWNDEGRADAP